MHKPHQAAKRNIIRFVLAVLCLGLLTIYVSATRRSVRIMPPESAEELAMRASPDNPYFDLVEAVRMLPQKPATTPEEEADYKRWTTSGESHLFLGGLVGLKLRNDSPKLLRYLDESEPALLRTRDALPKPNFRLPITWEDFRTYSYDDHAFPPEWRQIHVLRQLMQARGVQLLMIPTREDEAVPWLLDSLRYRVITSSDNPEGIGGDDMTLRFLDRAAGRVSDQALRTALSAVQTLHRRLQPPVMNLDFHWRVMDNTVRLRKRAPAPSSNSPAHRSSSQDSRIAKLERQAGESGINWLGKDLLFGYGLSQSSRIAAEHCGEFRAALQLPYPQFRDWAMANPQLTSPSERLSFISQWLALDNMGYSGYGYGLLTPWRKIQFFAEQYAWVDSSYSALEAILALELYHRDYGAYPDSLEALAPAYLPAVSQDAFTGQPLPYRKIGSDYSLTCTGPEKSGDPRARHAIGLIPFHSPGDYSDKNG
ncbi:MAG: hypothetical protein HZB26_14145 [Candidatus Hydrogenedentes bacterium]|nr:hypothetical protein [Candidatus Hydrogenedentota bacterium]